MSTEDATRIKITDKMAAIADIERQKIDALKTTKTIVKKALKKALESGKTVAGVSKDTGEMSFYEVTKALVAQAKIIELDITYLANREPIHHSLPIGTAQVSAAGRRQVRISHLPTLEMPIIHRDILHIDGRAYSVQAVHLHYIDAESI